MFTKKSKKFVASITALATLATTMSTFVTASATTYTCLLGDVDDDDEISVSDVIVLNKHLAGLYNFDDETLTRADANEDGIVDYNDSNYILKIATMSVSKKTKSVTLHQSLNNEKRAYELYSFAINDVTLTYNLTAETDYVNGETSSTRSTLENVADNENLNTLKLSIGDGSVGSGFIVGSHVIATAAHCVYNTDTSSYVSNITAYAYKADGSCDSFVVKSAHVPVLYIRSKSSVRDNYDYALLYVNEDLTDYGIWNIGYATEEAITNQNVVTTSGYNGGIRKYSTGNLTNDYYTNSDESHNYPYLRLHSTNYSLGGKSGGPLYYEIEGGVKSVIGVNTGGTETGGSWAVRMTPTLVKFYKQNVYIGL
jgi:V8-like Glu-specific endopeptidase